MGRVRRHKPFSLVITQARRPRGRGEAQEEVGICIGVSHNKSTNVTSMDCQLGNPCERYHDPRA
ncbi:hypothetical protein Tco_0197690, partial [Tanacetum coccineum]